MEPSALIAMLGATSVATVALAIRFGPRFRRRRALALLADPRRDPGAALGSPDRSARWAEVVAGTTSTMSVDAAWALVHGERLDHPPEAMAAAVAALRAGSPSDAAGVVALGITFGHVRGLPWRALLRELPSIGDPSPDAQAIEAERRWALGHHDAARTLCETLPADHWRACRVRGCLYAAAGDAERSASAHHAAWALAPAHARPALEHAPGWSVRPDGQATT